MPAPAPPEADWERIKTLFIDLYRQQEKTLDEVMRILASDHGFVASKKAFKTHITRWRAHKNYKAAEKRRLIQQRERQLGQSGGFGDWQHRDSQVKWDRVDRYAAVLAKQGPVTSDGSPGPSTSRIDCADVPLTATQIARYTSPEPQSINDPSEYLLGAVRDLYTLQIKTPLVLPNSETAKLDFSIYNDLFHAFGMIDHGSTAPRAISILRDVGNAMPVTVVSKPFAVLHAVLRLPNFLGKGEACDMFVSQILRLACREASKLPEHYLLKAVLTRINDMTVLQEERPRIGQVHLETVWNHRRILLDTSRVEVLIDAIYSNKGHMSSASVQNRAIDLMQVNTINTFNFCQLTLLLTASYLEHNAPNYYQLALDRAMDALQRLEDMDIGTSAPDLVSRKGYFVVQLDQRVATCHNHLGNILDGSEAYRKAFESASQYFGSESDRARLALLEWKTFLETHELLGPSAFLTQLP